MPRLDGETLGAVLKTALDAVVVMDLEGVVVGWNDVAERTFGWSCAEAHGQRMSEMVIPERYRAAHETGLAHYLATGDGPVLDRHIEIEALHRDGRNIPIELSITRTEQFGESVFLGFIRDISERREAAARQQLMIGELNHRVKNLLGVVSAIAHQTARSATSLPTFAEAFNGRLASLGRAHEILTAATWQEASIRSLVEETLNAFAGADAQVAASGPDVQLGPRNLLSLSMIFHEMMTNAVKYGGLSRPEGRLDLSWTIEEDRLSICWIETGLEGVQPPTRQGFGSKMISRMIAHELKGRSRTNWDASGMRFDLEFNLDRGDRK